MSSLLKNAARFWEPARANAAYVLGSTARLSERRLDWTRRCFGQRGQCASTTISRGVASVPKPPPYRRPMLAQALCALCQRSQPHYAPPMTAVGG
eukprot:5697595-Prymnesium_polylepis.1